MRNVIEKAVSICVIISLQDRKVKKLQLYNIKVSSRTAWRNVKSLEEKKATYTSYKHCVKRICKLYSKGRPAGKRT